MSQTLNFEMGTNTKLLEYENASDNKGLDDFLWAFCLKIPLSRQNCYLHKKV